MTNNILKESNMFCDDDIPSPKYRGLMPFWQTTDNETVRLYHGHVLNVAAKLPGKAIHTIVTSPPYWGLRNYGTGSKDELGLERTPEEFISKVIAIFRELKRVLRDDGTVWLNLGDTYSSGIKSSGGIGKGTLADGKTGQESNAGSFYMPYKLECGIDDGNLVGIPWRVALALQADGWMLRQDIIWHKPNPMPESVQNRCTKAHEYIFLLTKQMDYYYDIESVKDELQTKPHAPGNKQRNGGEKCQSFDNSSIWQNPGRIWGSDTKNKRSVWNVPSNPYPGAHFATFPPKLIEPCILAGTSEYGCCARCGDPYKRITVKNGGSVLNAEHLKRDMSVGNRNGKGASILDGKIGGKDTIGWMKTCICSDCDDVVPCTVLDPFMGAATTAITSLLHKRRVWGIELSKKYIVENQIPRIKQQLGKHPITNELIPRTS